MNILVLGNGFDLAHGLPTRYIDFLKWIEVIKQVSILDRGILNIDWCDIDEKVKKLVQEKTRNVRNNLFEQKKQLESLMIDNFWIDYFLIYKDNLKQNNKENWIDLETEIGNVIKELESNMTGFEDIAIDKLTNFILKKFIEKNFDNNQCMTFREITDILYNDLNKLIRLLEIYLSEYVEKIEIKKKVPEINVLTKIDKTSVSVDMPRVICFNYTHTYQKVYFPKSDTSSCVNYVHGEVDKENTIESNNMVLGIDEYLKKKDKNKKIEFIGFKKYFQRIYKGTGCEYKEWIEIIKKDDLQYQLKMFNAKDECAKNVNNKKYGFSVSNLNRVEKDKIELLER